MPTIVAISGRWPLPKRPEVRSTAPVGAFSVKQGHTTDITKFVERYVPLADPYAKDRKYPYDRITYGIRIQ